VKYISRKTSSRNQTSDVTITTRNVNAVRRFIVRQAAMIKCSTVTALPAYNYNSYTVSAHNTPALAVNMSNRFGA